MLFFNDSRELLTIGLKLAVSFILLLVYLNLAGRGQAARQSAADQIGGYVLGGIVGGMLYNKDVSVLELTLVILLWALMVGATRILKSRSRTVQRIIDGNSVLLFCDGHILEKGLRTCALSVRDFIAGMHLHGVHRLEEVQEVWMEANGQYTILKKDESPFAVALIEDGRLLPETLHRQGLEDNWLQQKLYEQGYKSEKDVAYAELYSENGKNILCVYPY